MEVLNSRVNFSCALHAVVIDIEVIQNNLEQWGISWNNAMYGVETCSLRHIPCTLPFIGAGMIEQMKAELPVYLAKCAKK